MAVEISILVLAAALPGLAMRRFGPWPARSAAALVLLALAYAVLDRPRETITSIPPWIGIVPTGPLSDEAAAATANRIGEGVGAGTGQLRMESAAGGLLQGLAVAALRDRSSGSPIVLWTGNLRPTGRPAVSKASAILSEQPVLPLDPDRVEVRSAGRLAKGRPGLLEVWLGDGLPTGLAGELRVRGPDGRVAHRAPIPAAGSVAESVVPVPFEPGAVGPHSVELTLTIPGYEFSGEGTVVVAGAPVVTVVGGTAEELAKAIAVQGLEVRAVPALPRELSGVLVLTEGLSISEQERVVRFVEDGGGLFLVGDGKGGAVPLTESPLAAVAPVVRMPLPERPAKDPKGEGRGAEADPKPDAPPDLPKSDPPAKKPETKPEKEPDKEKDEGAKGDTSKARTTDRKKEVERRSIAMVLVIDRSGSMKEPVHGGLTRMDLAKSSAQQTARALDDGDRLGIVSFGSEVARIPGGGTTGGGIVELGMTSVIDTPRIDRALESLHPRPEGTFVADGLAKARSLLAGVRAPIKYVVVVTDGALADVRDAYTRSVVRKYGPEGISLRIVQILSPNQRAEFDNTLKTDELAKLGNGYLIQQKDFTRVPRLVSSEVQKIRTQAGRPERKKAPEGNDALGPKKPDAPKPDEEPPTKPAEKPAEKDKPKPPDESEKDEPDASPAPATLAVHVLEESHLLAPNPEDGFPSIAGVLPARGRPGARTLLAAGPEGIPLLAFANRGLGKVGAWSADLVGPWGGAFTEDPAFPGRLAQWLQFLLPAVARSSAPRVVHRPAVEPAGPAPAEAAYLASFAGSSLRPIDSFVLPSPEIHTEREGQASTHAVFGVLLLVFLVVIEYLLVRRLRR